VRVQVQCLNSQIHSYSMSSWGPGCCQRSGFPGGSSLVSSGNPFWRCSLALTPPAPPVTIPALSSIVCLSVSSLRPSHKPNTADAFLDLDTASLLAKVPGLLITIEPWLWINKQAPPNKQTQVSILWHSHRTAGWRNWGQSWGWAGLAWSPPPLGGCMGVEIPFTVCLPCARVWTQPLTNIFSVTAHCHTAKQVWLACVQMGKLRLREVKATCSRCPRKYMAEWELTSSSVCMLSLYLFTF
jgi:hypothetical protein